MAAHFSSQKTLLREATYSPYNNTHLNRYQALLAADEEQKLLWSTQKKDKITFKDGLFLIS